MWSLEAFSEERLVLMEELNKLIEDLESKAIETWSYDKEGNLVKVKMY
jgi:hypothetical protein